MNNDSNETPKPEQSSDYKDAVDQALELGRPVEAPADTPVEATPLPVEAEQDVLPQPTKKELSPLMKAGVVVGGAALAGMAVLGIKAGVGAMADKGQEVSDQLDRERVALVTDYRETGQVPEGKTAIEAPAGVSTAYDMAQEITSGEDNKGLISDLHAQSNAQGYPGVEPGTGEVYVVDTKDITPEAAKDLAPKPEFNVPDGHTDVVQ